MNDSDAVLEEANRCAHRVAKAGLHVRRVCEEEGIFDVSACSRAAESYERALDAYEEIERRAQAKPEATGKET